MVKKGTLNRWGVCAWAGAAVFGSWGAFTGTRSADCHTGCADVAGPVDEKVVREAMTALKAEAKRVGHQGSTPLMSACFEEGTDWKIVSSWEEAQRRLGWNGSSTDYQLAASWGLVAGKPSTVTWSFVPDGVVIPGAAGGVTSPSNLFSNFDAQFASMGGRDAWIQAIQACFDRWEQLSGIDFERVSVGGNPWDRGDAFSAFGVPGQVGDIRVGGYRITGPGGVLAYAYYPNPGFGEAGNIAFDTGDNYARPENDFRWLRNVMMHEIGHAIGFAHTCPRDRTKLMEPNLNTGFDGPQVDDIGAGQETYGDPIEGGLDNDVIGRATPLGNLSAGSAFAQGAVPSDSIYPAQPIPANSSVLSIVPNDAADYFSFSLPTSGIVRITLTPVGRTYPEGPQVGDCSQGTNYDSLRQANLTFDLRNGSNNLIAGATNRPAGEVDDLQLNLQANLTYFARVTAVGGTAKTQKYTLRISRQVAQISFSPTSSHPFIASAPYAATLEVLRNSDNSVLATLSGSALLGGAISGQVDGIPAGVPISVRTRMASHLTQRTASFVWDGSSPITVPSDGPFLNGDVDGDDRVTIFDYIGISESFDTSTGQSGFNGAADLDRDGTISIFDYIIMGSNFDRVGSTQ